MIINNKPGQPTSWVICLAATACVPTQSSAFDQMTAVDAERAAQSGKDPAGAINGVLVRASSTAVGFRVSITSPDIDIARQLAQSGRPLMANAS
jgi:hypothetical protein